MGSDKYPYKGIIDHLANRGFSNGTNAWTDNDHTGKQRRPPVLSFLTSTSTQPIPPQQLENRDSSSYCQYTSITYYIQQCLKLLS